MNHDYPDYLHDMNHDGDIDGLDFALFHEMLDEDQEEEDDQRSRPQSYYSSEPWTIYHSIAKGLLLLASGGYLYLLLNEVLPINGFTAVLALFNAVCFLRVLLL